MLSNHVLIFCEFNMFYKENLNGKKKICITSCNRKNQNQKTLRSLCFICKRLPSSYIPYLVYLKPRVHTQNTGFTWSGIVCHTSTTYNFWIQKHHLSNGLSNDRYILILPSMKINYFKDCQLELIEENYNFKRFDEIHGK